MDRGRGFFGYKQAILRKGRLASEGLENCLFVYLFICLLLNR